MATLQTDEANIIDAEAINWRLIVYPLLLVLIVGAGALGYYYYLQNQRDEAETNARLALVKATTPEEFLKVADQFPHTDQAMLATLRAAALSLDKHDDDGALNDYRKITENTSIGAQWHDTAELGIASALEAKNNPDGAISAYMEVAHRGDQSPYAPYAYSAVARIYHQRGDTNNESQVLQAAAALNPDSPFTRQAQAKLKELAPAQPGLSFPVSPVQAAPALPSAAPATPAPPPPQR